MLCLLKAHAAIMLSATNNWFDYLSSVFKMFALKKSFRIDLSLEFTAKNMLF